MVHTAHSTTQLTPLHNSECGFWYANFDGTCIAIGDTRADVEKQINAFLGK